MGMELQKAMIKLQRLRHVGDGKGNWDVGKEPGRIGTNAMANAILGFAP